MAYITDADYGILITEKDLILIQQSDADNRERAELTAMDQIKSYLSTRYDTEAIFAAEGDDRNKLLLMYFIDIVLFHLHSHLPGRMGIEQRRERYKDALKWLQDVANGSISPDLPTYEDDSESYPIRYGSNTKSNPYN